jgi:phosphoribosylglycinamide formyltransferase-1
MLNGRTVRTAVLVSGGGTNLQAILDARGKVIRHAEIVLVVSGNPEAYALERAKRAGIPALAISAKLLGGREAFEQELQRILELHKIELIVLAGFLTILSPDFIGRWDHRILNIHPALIPSFCGKDYYGLRVHRAALERGVKLTGATVHYVNEIPDGGEIILQKAVEVLPGDTPETLQRRVMEQAEWILLPQAVEMVARQLKVED